MLLQYDIFISYRRSSGKNYARTIKPELEKRGFRVFLDFDELKDGVFDKRIMDAINDAPVFLMILSKGALDRCINEGDWVRLEILYANESNKHIVPVEVDKSFREIPDNIPNDIKSILGAHQFAQIDTESLLQVSMDKLVRERISPYVSKSMEKTPNVPTRNEYGTEVHISIDADCDCYKFNKHIATMKVGQDNVIILKSGKYRLSFVLKQYPELNIDITYTASPDIYSDIVEVSFKKMIDKKEKEIATKKEDEARKRKIEEEKKLKAKRDQERKQWIIAKKNNLSQKASNALRYMKRAFSMIWAFLVSIYADKKRRTITLLCLFSLISFYIILDKYTNYLEEEKERKRLEWLKWHPTDSDKQYELGILYLKGSDDVPQNVDSALSYLNKSASQDYALANYSLGNLFRKGDYRIPVNDSLAVQYLEKAARQGVAPAYAEFGDMCMEGRGIEKDIWRAYKNYKVGAEKRDSAALWRLTKCYIDKKGIIYLDNETKWKIAKEYYDGLVKNDIKKKTTISYDNIDILIKKGLDFSDVFYKELLNFKIDSCLRVLARQRHHSAVLAIIPRVKYKKEKTEWIILADSLGIFPPSNISYNAWIDYADSLFNAKNYKTALKSYQSALNVDSTGVKALQRKAWFLFNGKLIDQNMQEAFQIYKSTKSSLSLSYCYFKGKGITMNLDSARYYYNNFNKNDNTYAKWYNNRDYDTLLLEGDCLYYGIPIEYDTLAARKKYELCAKNGNRIAQYKLGRYYSYTRNDKNKAKVLFEKLASNNFAPAQYELGKYYESKKMFRTAVGWYEKAARNKSKEAANALNWLYYWNNNGITKDESVPSNSEKRDYWRNIYEQL